MKGRALVMSVSVLVSALLSGCSFNGINSYPLPFTKGHGADDITMTVYLQNAANLVPNSEVKYRELTIGSVRRIVFDRGDAKLTVGVERSADLPADLTARVAQKSLLGAEYLELSSSAGPSAPRLTTGQVLHLDRTGRYPETEEVLAGAAMLLNGGGLPQVRVITHELNQALDGRQADVRTLISRLVTFTRTLDQQKSAILDAIGQTDRLAHSIAVHDGTVERALTELPKGVETLDRERQKLVTTLSSLSDFGAIAHRVVSESEGNLTTTLNNLRPVTKALVDSGQNLINAAEAITYPFPTRAISKAFFGDYINLYATFDIDPKGLLKTFLGGTPLDGVYSGLVDGLPLGTAAGALNPLLDPLLGQQAQLLNGPKKKPTTAPSMGTKPSAGTRPATSPATPAPAPSATASSRPNLLQALLGGGR